MSILSPHIPCSAERPRSINDKLNIPFYIYAPDFRNTSGGIRVLHYLCHILNELGEEAYILHARHVSPRLRTPQLTLAKLREHYLAGQTPITIYPEIVSNNPMRTPLIARWLLNIPGHLGKPIDFGPSDLILYYEKWCVPEGMDGTPLFLHPVDDSVFNNENNPDDGERIHECWYANKYFKLGQPILEEHRGLVSLGQEIPRTPEEIAQILRKSKVLYCYEPSGIISEAQACGCPVQLVRSPYWALPPDDTHHKIPGLAVYGEENALERALATLPQIPQVHAKARDNSWVMTRDVASWVYASQAQIMETLARSEHPIDQLWSMDRKARAKNADRLIEKYSRSGLFFPDMKEVGDLSAADPSVQYPRFYTRKTLQEIDGQLLAERMHQWAKKPLFNIIVDVRNGEEELLANTLDSVAAQWYPDWHLTVIAEAEIPEGLGEIPQITWVTAPAAQHTPIFNELLPRLPGDWMVLMEAGCTLEAHALVYYGDTLNHAPSTRLIYSDEDKHSEHEGFESPYFRPDFDLERLRSSYYFGPCIAVERAMLQAQGGLVELGNTGRYDISLKVFEQFRAPAFAHLSEVVVHTPAIGLRPVESSDEQAILTAHLARLGIQAQVSDGLVTGTQHVAYAPPIDHPKVSIIIPTRDQAGYLQHCVDSILSETDYPNFELIVVDHGSTDPDVAALIADLHARPALAGKLQTTRNEAPFNYAELCNQGAALATGECLLFLDNDTEIIQKSWLSTLVGHLFQPGIAAVAPRLSCPDGQLSVLNQTPRILGMRGVADHFANPQANLVEPGYFGNLQMTQEVSALSGSCFMVRHNLFRDLGGFDAVNTPVHEPVLELCLRLRQAGQKLVWTPSADVVHHGKATRKRLITDLESSKAIELGQDKELAYLLTQHLDQLANDPYYHRHLSLLQPYAIEPHAVIDWDNRFHERLHILASPLTSASGEYRITAPFRALQRAGLAQCCVIHPIGRNELRVLTPVEVARAAPDNLVLQHAIDNTQLMRIKQYRQYNKGLFMTYAVDDVMGHLPRKHYLYNFQIREGKSRLREGLSQCDRLIVSTEPLADLCRGMIDDIVVVPNRLEGGRWEGLESKRRFGKKPRVGWAGAQQHLGDLELIKEVVEATHQEVEWVFMGMCPEFLKPFVHEEHSFVNITEYPAKLASLNLDLAIAPLEQVVFNEGKSNLRLLEYGIMGWPVVCTDIFPYQTNAAPVKRVNNHAAEWIEAIRERINDLDAAAKEGDQLKAWVRQHYLLDDHLDDWMNALRPR